MATMIIPPQVIGAPLITSRVSTGASGEQAAGGNSRKPAVSADGRYIAFYSGALNLAAGDPDTVDDVYVKDTETGAVTLVSTSTLGVKGNGVSRDPRISADGRYVTFFSEATNLDESPVDLDKDALRDIYVKDMMTGLTILATTNAAGTVKGNGHSQGQDISDEGRYVVFASSATNLTPSDSDGTNDIFRKDLVTGAVDLISTSTGGAIKGNGTCFNPDVSSDGRFVVFESAADNLVPGDSGGYYDVFLKDTQTGSTSMVSTTAAGAQGNGASKYARVSDSGRYVTFESDSTNLVFEDADVNHDIYVKDMQNASVTLVSVSNFGVKGNESSLEPRISADGRKVAFESDASNLHPGDSNLDTDVFVKDLDTGALTALATSPGGMSGSGWNAEVDISPDGMYTAFVSDASDLVPSDTNTLFDVFLTRSGRNSVFSWYDNLGAGNWVIMANPDRLHGLAEPAVVTYGTHDAWFDLTVGGERMAMPALQGYAPGQVPEARSLAASFGKMGGPVDAGFFSRRDTLVSQRTIWGTSSLDEVVSMPGKKLSDHYIWTWYDELTPGFANWVLVANPGADMVDVEIRIAGDIVHQDTLLPGASIQERFPGEMGGPVEVQAWAVNSKARKANVIASQRVLSNGGTAFNEEPGIPRSALSDRYYWSWYDMNSPGAANWILIANPQDSGVPIHWQITVAGELVAESTEPIPPGESDEPLFPGEIGGPVEVRSFTNPGSPDTSGAASMVSQRVLWGPSFEETPGQPLPLGSKYHWTWYDMASPGALNWVMIANPEPLAGADIYYKVWVQGAEVASGGPISPGDTGSAMVPTLMGGPVEVWTFTDPANWQTTLVDSVASQRVIWNGFFNEVTGTNFD